MKRLFLAILCIFIAGVTGCTAQKPLNPVLDFSAKVRISDDYALKGLEAEISSTMQGAASVKVTTPDELWGLTYKWSDGFELIYDGLHCKTQKGYLPKECFAEALYNVFCALSRVEECTSFSDGVALYEGECASGHYKATTDSKGNIQNISIEEINLSADFTYQ